MKDELRKYESDATSRKTATDWLMQVISGKKPVGFHANGSDPSGELEAAEGEEERGTAVGEMPLGRSLPARWARDREPVEQEVLEAKPLAGEFTVEDLCGAPVVPVIKVAVAPREEITAEDVCWVPVERRLKPQASAAAEYFPAPRLQIVQAQNRNPLPEERPETEIGGAETRGPLDSTSESTGFRDGRDGEITAEDISREAAPYMVEPIWTGPAEGASAIDAEERVITAEDICRDWVIQEKQESAVDTRDGVVLPFSYRVLKSANVAEQSQAAAVESEALATSAPVAPTAPEAQEPVLPKIFAESVVAEPLAARVEEETPVPEARVEAAKALPELAVEAAAETQIVEPESAEAAGSFAEAVVAETAPAAEAETETGEIAEQYGEALGELSDSQATGAKPASVFARTGFWEEAARAEGETRVEGEYEQPQAGEVKRGMKRRYPSMEELGEIPQPPEGWMSAWKTLLRLGSLLPWVAKALPMLESGELGEPGASGLGVGAAGTGGVQEMRQDVSGLRLIQYEIRTTVQDHSMQLKRMEEQLGRVREALEASGSDSGEVADNVRTMTKMVRIAGMGLGGLLLALIVLVAIMLANGR